MDGDSKSTYIPNLIWCPILVRRGGVIKTYSALTNILRWEILGSWPKPIVRGCCMTTYWLDANNSRFMQYSGPPTSGRFVLIGGRLANHWRRLINDSSRSLFLWTCFYRMFNVKTYPKALSIRVWEINSASLWEQEPHKNSFEWRICGLSNDLPREFSIIFRIIFDPGWSNRSCQIIIINKLLVWYKSIMIL